MLEGTIHAERSSTVRTEVGPAGGAEPRRRDLLARMSAMSLAGFGRQLDGDRETETEVTAVARAWLDLVDAGRPTVSWTAAAPSLRETVGLSDWCLAVRAARASLGRCRSRTLRDRSIVEAFPGVPRGPYAVIHFASVFDEHRAVETVTTCLGDDGRWRVAAYFLR